MRELICGCYFPWKPLNIRHRLWCRFINHTWVYKGFRVGLPGHVIISTSYQCYYCKKWKTISHRQGDKNE